MNIGRRTAGAAQPGLRLRPLPRPGGHRVQRAGRCGVRTAGHQPGTLRGGGHAGDAPPQDHHRPVGPHAGGDDGPAVHADGDLNAHHGPPAEEKTGLKGYCVQQAAIPAFAESVFMTISRKRSKMRKNLQ